MALFQRIANAARRSATTKLTRGPRRKANRLKPRALLGVETLERREVMAGNLTAGLSPDLTIASTNPKFAPEAIAVQPSAARVNALVSGRTLLVEGTDRLDRIVVSQDGNTLAVGGVRILHNGRAVTTVDARLIDKVEVRGYGGDDVITMTTLDRPAEVWGGEGVDQIIGGRRGDTIPGGTMMDTLWGGDGADAVHGDEG
ncbi:MAG TPA: hypothetical protein VEQ85_07425, partial [Lacipirellulaceae bacterium]|nr:hypothetical protein [Lacipirellulaceae bacterium]